MSGGGEEALLNILSLHNNLLQLYSMYKIMSLIVKRKVEERNENLFK